MLLQFTLSMPGCPSWNGKWSGDDQLFAKVVNPGRSQKAIRKAQQVLDIGYFSYSWSDGWRARVSVKEITSREARKVRRHSRGFSGYDWMVDSIMERLEIKASHELPEAKMAQSAIIESD